MNFLTLIPGILDLIRQIFPNAQQDQEQRFKLALQAMLNEAEIAKSQAATNTEEAKSSNFFIAGWRPCIGWVCALSFAWMYFLQPLTTYFIVLFGYSAPTYPAFDSSQLMALTLGMLGLGAYRTAEKISAGKLK